MRYVLLRTKQHLGNVCWPLNLWFLVPVICSTMAAIPHGMHCKMSNLHTGQPSQRGFLPYPETSDSPLNAGSNTTLLSNPPLSTAEHSRPVLIMH